LSSIFNCWAQDKFTGDVTQANNRQDKIIQHVYLCQLIKTYMNSRTGVVFLLLAAQNLQSLFNAIHAPLPVCIWIIIIAVALLVPCWLGTPKDSW
jgi:hypothetical protein